MVVVPKGLGAATVVVDIESTIFAADALPLVPKKAKPASATANAGR